jgi:hypothetical protein
VPRKEPDSVQQVLLRTHRLKVAQALPEAPTLLPELLEYRSKLRTTAADSFEAWRANPHETPVALKFCLNEKTARALQNEARLLDQVRQQGTHSGVVRLLRTYLRARPSCLEYEYVEGGDLAGLIKEWYASGGPKAAAAAKIVLRLAERVGHMHRLDPP